MTVSDSRGSMEEGRADQFPIGMRVLAVDDDLSCLRMLEMMLTCCQYRVTTTGQATEALRLLRENRDGFDLVISDVHMPDMDGFKLLELVGLEMDLPVIMLSGNGQTEAVMKGINHGACDYLVKPVRIQELKNIWQHVVRRKISETRDENSSDDGEDFGKGQVSNPGGQLPATSGASDRNGRLNRKRKDQIEQYEDEYEGNTNEDNNGSTQKKQRVVWSIELHRKFVAAVNQLGVDRAVPKKILEIMNVEKLTRENVASHLQKYRLYLKRLNFMAIRQAHMAAALRGRQPSYHSMNQLEEFGNVHPTGGSMQLPAFASFQPNGVLGRMNTSTGFRQHGVLPSGIVQHGRVHNNTSNCINAGLLGSADGKFLQEMPMPLDMDQAQHNTVTEVNNRFAGVYSGSGLAIGSSSNSIANVANNPLEFPLNQQHMSSDPYKIGLGDSSNLSGLGERNNTWQGAVPSYNFPANSSPMAVSSSNITMPSLSIHDVNPIVAYLDTGLSEASSDNVAVAPLCDSGIESYVQHQANLLGRNTMLMPTCVDENSEFLSNSGSKWGELNHNLAHNPNALFSSSASLSHLQIADTNAENTLPRNMEMDQFLAQDCRTDNQMNYTEERTSENTNTHGGFSSNNCCFPDLGKDDLAFFGDMIRDMFSPSGCM